METWEIVAVIALIFVVGFEIFKYTKKQEKKRRKRERRERESSPRPKRRSSEEVPAKASPSGGLTEDLLSALKNMGYTKAQARAAADKAFEQAPEGAGLDVLVRAALGTVQHGKDG